MDYLCGLIFFFSEIPGDYYSTTILLNFHQLYHLHLSLYNQCYLPKEGACNYEKSLNWCKDVRS